MSKYWSSLVYLLIFIGIYLLDKTTSHPQGFANMGLIYTVIVSSALLHMITKSRNDIAYYALTVLFFVTLCLFVFDSIKDKDLKHLIYASSGMIFCHLKFVKGSVWYIDPEQKVEESTPTQS